MLMPVPPWEVPPDWIGAMTKGATVGLDSARLAQEGRIAAQKLLADQQEAAGRLGLGYAEVANRGALGRQEIEENAKQRGFNNALDLAKFHDSSTYRARENDLRERGLDLREIAQAVKHKSPFHVGNQLVTIDDNGNVKVLFNADDQKVNPLDHQDYIAALRTKRSANSQLSRTDLNDADKARWKKEYEDADAILKKVRGKYPGSSGAEPDFQRDNQSAGDAGGVRVLSIEQTPQP